MGKAMNQNELQRLIERGEGLALEFKERLSGLDRELVAFANGQGGRLLVGVSDDGRIVGHAVDNRLRSQVQDIANNCQPPLRLEMEKVGDVLVVTVPEGEDKPYQCSSGFYVRKGPNSQKLSRDELADFFRDEEKVLRTIIQPLLNEPTAPAAKKAGTARAK